MEQPIDSGMNIPVHSRIIQQATLEIVNNMQNGNFSSFAFVLQHTGGEPRWMMPHCLSDKNHNGLSARRTITILDSVAKQIDKLIKNDELNNIMQQINQKITHCKNNDNEIGLCLSVTKTTDDEWAFSYCLTTSKNDIDIIRAAIDNLYENDSDLEEFKDKSAQDIENEYMEKINELKNNQ
jgi:hypothetical protein